MADTIQTLSAGGSGTGGDWNTLQQFSDQNLTVNGPDRVILNVDTSGYANGAFDAFTDFLNGWIVADTSLVVIRTDPALLPLNGKFYSDGGNGACFSAGWYIMDVKAPCTFENLQFIGTASNRNSLRCFSTCSFVNCTFEGTVDNVTPVELSSPFAVSLENCQLYTKNALCVNGTVAGVITATNCTMYSPEAAIVFNSTGAPAVLKNNVVSSGAVSAACFAGTVTGESTNNYGGPSASTPGLNAGNISNAVGVDIVDIAARDFRIVSSGGIDGAGTSPPEVPTDIIGTTSTDPSQVGAFAPAGGGTTPPSGVDAGGPYSGDSASPIDITGTFTPGSDASPTLLWTEVTSLGGAFGDASAAVTTFTPDVEGAYTLQFSVDPSDGDAVTDTAELSAGGVHVAGWEIGAWEVAGGSIVPPTVDAGGPYSGTVGTPIALAGASIIDGTGAYTIKWTTNGSGTFSDDTILNPTYTPGGVGVDKQITLTVNPDDGSAVADIALLTATATGVTGWEIGAWETGGNAPSVLRLEADLGNYTLIGRQVNLIIGGGEGPIVPVTLQAAMGTYSLVGFPALLQKGRVTLSAELGSYGLTGFPADLSLGGFIRPSYTWELTEGEGTVAKCSVEGFDGTVDSWGTTPDNNKRWPINEGTGALLNETETGDDTYDAAIQNFIEGGWPD